MVRIRVWLLLDYSNHTTATFWIHRYQKDNKLSATPRPVQLDAKARPFRGQCRRFSARGVLGGRGQSSMTPSLHRPRTHDSTAHELN